MEEEIVEDKKTKPRKKAAARKESEKTKKVLKAAPKVITVSGKRKRAIAKATIREGSGIIKINKSPIETFDMMRKLSLLEPLRIAQDVLKKEPYWNIDINVKSGGVEGQTDASRLAIARALVAFTKNEELRRAFLSYDRSLLIADVRRKEQRKPGDSKARAKRQKSYR